MIKLSPALVALALAAGIGSAQAATRTINVWGAQLEVPTSVAEAAPVPAMKAGADSRFMSAPDMDRPVRHAR